MIDNMDGESTANLSSDNQAYNDNISFNSSSISSYSAEEQIIQQRGRRSPQKTSYNDQYYLQHQAQFQPVSTRDMFLRLKQTSMRSPDSKNIQSDSYVSPHNESVDSGRSSLNQSSFLDQTTSPEKSCRKSKRNLNKSLLRTPVKRRLTLKRGSSSTIKKHRRR